MNERIKYLTEYLNEQKDNYYNKNKSVISDAEFDKLIDELKELEEKEHFSLSNSPTKTVGYEVKSELEKVRHNHPMLSLDKTKDVNELIRFLGNRPGLMMLKLDGLTISLRYLNGELVSAETRGNGEIGEDILHNAKVFKNIPLHIDFKDELIVDGEAIITYKDFEEINSQLPDDQKFSNVRNLASGSVRQLDSKIAQQRNIKFIAWKMVKGIKDNDFTMRLEALREYGFEVVPYRFIYDRDSVPKLEVTIELLKAEADKFGMPIDGMVVGYTDVQYGESLGQTSHHLRSQIAFKFKDDEYETKLIDIEWSLGKTGQITPVAIFEPVEIEGAIVEKASLSNLSILKETLGYPYKGQVLYITKRNAIIPKVERAIKKDYKDVKELADEIDNCKVCPVCGERVSIRQDSNSDVLICTNPDCKGKLLGKLTHFVSRDAMNIDGLSEATLQKFIDLGWLNNFADIYYLNCHESEMRKLEGFGNKSVDKLLKSIEDSKHTTLDRFINALSIPLVGRSASKAISKYFGGDYEKFRTALPTFNFTQLDDFGKTTNESIHKWCEENINDFDEFANYFVFEKESVSSGNQLKDMTFCITGSLEHFTNRDEAKNKIEQCGGKVVGSVSAKLSFLVNNDVNSTSSKNVKAQKLGVPIITEEELINMIQ